MADSSSQAPPPADATTAATSQPSPDQGSQLPALPSQSAQPQQPSPPTAEPAPAATPAVDPADESTWSWLSSMASSAYNTVAGTPDSYDELQPTVFEGTNNNDAASPSPEFGHVDPASRQALWKQLYSVVGMDVINMRLSLPIWLFEPTTALSRMAETFEYSDLLDRAAACPDPVLRDCLVSAFVVSAFSHTERVRKPFNPVLGETFEFINPVSDMKFYAEQVSHHPPVSVSRSEGKGWVAGEVVNVHATFQGNSVEVTNVGSRYIHLTETGDRYTWTLPTAVVSNLFVGGAFVDHFGTIELRNSSTDTNIMLEFCKTGWFSTGRYQVKGELQDATGQKIITFRGAWNKYFDCKPYVPELESASPKISKTKGEGHNRLWKAGSHLLRAEDGGGVNGIFANCTKFTKKTLAFDEDYASELPPTDSRLRPDRIALEAGDSALAAEEKLCVEQKQRERRAAVANGAPPAEPKYFRKISEEENQWEPNGTYWTESRSFVGFPHHDY